MLLVAVMAGVMSLGAATGEAREQSLTETWRTRVAPGALMNAEEDEAVALAHWDDDNAGYVFVTGWGTNSTVACAS